MDSAVTLSKFRSTIREVQGYHLAAAEDWGCGQTTAVLVWLPVLAQVYFTLLKVISSESCHLQQLPSFRSL
jgi:hypothetical protein